MAQKCAPKTILQSGFLCYPPKHPKVRPYDVESSRTYNFHFSIIDCHFRACLEFYFFMADSQDGIIFSSLRILGAIYKPRQEVFFAVVEYVIELLILDMFEN
jgi:hypothetical protein